MPPARWNWEYAWEITPALIEGMMRTVFATLLGIVVALVLGLFLALGRRSERKLISYPVAWFVEFVRSTPLLVQLFFLFYAMPQIEFLPRSISTLSP
jgi:polar amino acid transport system permease protein